MFPSPRARPACRAGVDVLPPVETAELLEPSPHLGEVFPGRCDVRRGEVVALPLPPHVQIVLGEQAQLPHLRQPSRDGRVERRVRVVDACHLLPVHEPVGDRPVVVGDEHVQQADPFPFRGERRQLHVLLVVAVDVHRHRRRPELEEHDPAVPVGRPVRRRHPRVDGVPDERSAPPGRPCPRSAATCGCRARRWRTRPGPRSPSRRARSPRTTPPRRRRRRRGSSPPSGTGCRPALASGWSPGCRPAGREPGRTGDPPGKVSTGIQPCQKRWPGFGVRFSARMTAV